MKSILISIVSILITSSSFAEATYEFAGKHFVASYLDCNQEAICDLQGLMDAMDQAVQASGATVLEKSHYIFEPHGLTAVYLLSESHASLHTYPEFGSCFVDLFTCGNRTSSEAFDASLRSYLRPKEVNARFFLRNQATIEIPYGPALEPSDKLSK